jgi:hypothetical protein
MELLRNVHRAVALPLILLFVSIHLQARELTLIKKTEGSRAYKGEIQLRGSYRIDYEGSDLEGSLFFHEDDESRVKLPDNDFREGIIALNPVASDVDQIVNINRMLKRFHIPKKRSRRICGYEGVATIVIKDFIAIRAGSENGDIATLVQVVSSEKPSPILCE